MSRAANSGPSHRSIQIPRSYKLQVTISLYTWDVDTYTSLKIPCVLACHWRMTRFDGSHDKSPLPTASIITWGSALKRTEDLDFAARSKHGQLRTKRQEFGKILLYSAFTDRIKIAYTLSIGVCIVCDRLSVCTYVCVCICASVGSSGQCMYVYMSLCESVCDCVYSWIYS